jgi:hypothetical protein
MTLIGWTNCLTLNGQAIKYGQLHASSDRPLGAMKQVRSWAPAGQQPPKRCRTERERKGDAATTARGRKGLHVNAVN